MAQKDLLVEVSDLMMIYYYNLNNIHLAKNIVFHSRTKHIEVLYHFVSEHILFGEIELVYVMIDWQAADIFTKPLGLDKLRKFSNTLGLEHLDLPNLRGRNSERSGRDRKPKLDKEFNLGMDEEAEDGSGGATEGTSPSRRQPNRGKVKTRRVERPGLRHG